MDAQDLTKLRNNLLDTRPVTGTALAREYTDLIDRTVQSLATNAGTDNLTGIALVATGSYGRRELAPQSDIDIAFLAADEDDPAVAAVVKRAFQLIMEMFLDKIGLKLGYSYRAIDDIIGLDFETKTALLDARLLAGNKDLAQSFAQDLRESLDAGFILQHVRARMEMPSALYVMEPDVKNGPGGLRDLHAVSWTAQALYNCEQEEVLQALEENRTAEHAARMLDGCKDSLSQIRNALHIVAGKPLDILSVERQPEVADILGYSSPEALMQDYYNCASEVRASCRTILDTMAASRLKVDRVFAILDGRLSFAEKPQAFTKPGALVRAFRLARDYNVDIGERLAREIRDTTEDLVSDPHNLVELKEIFAGPYLYNSLSSLVDLGVLQKLLPPVGDLMHTVPEEKVHEYTVGQHSLFVIKRLEEMRDGGDSLYSGLWKMVHDPPALMLAALLHDIGKLRGGVHTSLHNEAEAGRVARLLGFPEHTVETLEFLVANHELMSATARRCDVASDVVIDEFVQIVENIDVLRMLFLLNVADVLSVGQASWSEMQRRFLEELYFAAEAKLSHPEPRADDEERYTKRLKRQLSLANLPEDIVHEHCDSMPPSYLLNTKPERIAAHIEHVMTVKTEKLVVELKDRHGSRVTELTIVAKDKGPGLLSYIAGALFALDIAVHDASVFTRKAEDSIAIDTLWIDHLGDRLPYAKRKEVERELQRVLKGDATVVDLLKARGKREPNPPICNSAQILRHHDDRSIVEIRAADAEGLLYAISQAIANLGWNVQSARVTTIGRQAVDSFEVIGPRGCLSARDRKQLRQALGCAA